MAAAGEGGGEGERRGRGRGRVCRYGRNQLKRWTGAVDTIEAEKWAWVWLVMEGRLDLRRSACGWCLAAGVVDMQQSNN
jgi:hypothetical protein